MSFTCRPVGPVVTCQFLVTHVWLQLTYATRHTLGTNFANFVSLNVMMFCTGVNLGFMPRGGELRQFERSTEENILIKDGESN
jgi:hypothetical protein